MSGKPKQFRVGAKNLMPGRRWEHHALGQSERRMLVLEAGLDLMMVWELGFLGVGGREFPSDPKAKACVSLGLTLETPRTGEGAGSEGVISASPSDEAKAQP